jgi:5-methylcytosine-specific restriction endonuclease McrA
MSQFLETQPKLETIWRAIILFGRNVATYKFALGKSLLDLASEDKTFISMEELAVPFSKYITEHLKTNDKQGISSSSKFLEQCRLYNNNQCSKDELLSQTVSLGFNNVIDAFHVVGRTEVPKRFFIDERKDRDGINITDELLQLKEKLQFNNLPYEVEARWRLVETAWSLNINPQMLEVRYDENNRVLYTHCDDCNRINITSCRDSLNGYQKGKCFYCFREIIVDDSDPDRLAEVDHFFPHMLKSSLSDVNIDGIWNLVLACQNCNRGVGGKFVSVPQLKLLQRLYTRNEYLINSHHPLRETLIKQTGKTEILRKQYLQQVDSRAIDLLIHRWEPKEQYDTRF